MSTTAWFSQGFRPFFLGATVWAALAMLLWLIQLTTPGWLSVDWHRHEMLFGYAGAVITGFLLTAIPNWTRRLPVQGMPLLLLFVLWVAGRLIGLSGAQLDFRLALIVDGGFLVVVTGLALRELLAAGNHPNLPVVGLVGVLSLASVLDLLGYAIGWRAGLAAISLLIALVGGRVTPSFTRNWLAKRDAPLPVPFNRLDRTVLLITALAWAAWVFWPEADVSGVLLLLAGVCGLIRLSRWQGCQTLAEPLLLVLHLGYGWTMLGVATLGLGVVWPGLPLSGLHLLTAGGIALMTMAVMTRATLGHTGRALHASRTTTAIYILIQMGALLRALAGFWPSAATHLWLAAGLLWVAGFSGFAIVYGPMLVRPKLRS